MIVLLIAFFFFAKKDTHLWEKNKSLPDNQSKLNREARHYVSHYEDRLGQPKRIASPQPDAPVDTCLAIFLQKKFYKKKDYNQQ